MIDQNLSLPGLYLNQATARLAKLRLGGIIQGLLFAAWLLSMITLPISKWIWGEAALTWGVPLSVGLQAGLVISILIGAWGLVETARVAGIVMLATLLVEAIGTATGLPFGAYEYTAKLQPQVAHVPLMIPVAWLMMLPVAWSLAFQICGKISGVLFIALSALAMTTWDLFLDPQMVAWGFWVWLQPGGYFGIPWLNFAGWLLTAALVTALVRPKKLTSPLFILIYGTVWILETIGLAFFWDLPGPAVVGAVGMGLVLALVGSKVFR